MTLCLAFGRGFNSHRLHHSYLFLFLMIENRQSTIDTETSIRKLEKYKEQGYVFHGSPDCDLDVLEPRKAVDTVDMENVYNNDTAVYAAIEPSCSILFATLPPETLPADLFKAPWTMRRSYLSNAITARIPYEWREYVLNSCGTVYVLPKETFDVESDRWQTKSKESVIPIDSVLVTFQDFEKLGGRIDWDFHDNVE